MEIADGIFGRKVRITDERWEHLSSSHPEMAEQFFRIEQALLNPDEIVESRADNQVELYYRKFTETPVGDKYLCVVLKIIELDVFVLTAYFTDTIKKGQLIWEKK